MKLEKLITAAALAAFGSGCAVQKTMVATGGSRSDGTVELAYQVGGFEVPKVDYVTALDTAKQRCVAWGYGDAEPFGAEQSTCVQWNMYGCVTSKVSITYQCTGIALPEPVSIDRAE